MSSQMYFGYVNDEKAAVIVQQLAAMKNSDVTSLELSLSEHLTVRGAQVLAHGLMQSQINNISYQHRVELNGNVLRPLLEVAFQRFQELRLDFYLNDSAANVLSEILLSLDDDDDDNDGENHVLQTLSFKIGANMTAEGAQQLSIGLRHAKLKSLGLFLENDEVLPTIVVAALDSVKELLLSGSYCLDDDAAVRIGDALFGNTSLQTFQFNVWPHLSGDAAVRLANGISHSNIVGLHLNHYGSNNELPADVMNAFYKGVARSPTIRNLILGQQFHATPGLAQCLTGLHTFEMMHSLAVEDVPTLMKGLRNATDLSSLTLHGFPLAFDEQQEDDSDSDQQDDDSDNESSSPDLQRIQATTAEQLMLAIANHPSLYKLTIWHCRDVGFAGLAMIGMHLPNITNLLELCLDYIGDKYTKSDKRESVKQAFQRACQALVHGVKANWNLRVLTIEEGFGDGYGGAYLPSNVEQEINFYLDLNKSGRYMLHETDSERVPTGLWCHVLAKCGNKADFLYYYLREQPTLAASGM